MRICLMLDMSSMFMNIHWDLAKVFYCCWVNYLVDVNYICLIKCIAKCKKKLLNCVCVSNFVFIKYMYLKRKKVWVKGK